MQNTQKKYKVIGLVMKAEPTTLGHLRLYNYASAMADHVNIYFAGSREPISMTYPFITKQRIEMFKPHINERTSMIAVPNIGASSNKEWIEHIFECTQKVKGKLPTGFMSGDSTNSEWYESEVSPETGEKLEIIFLDRSDVNLMSGTEIRKQLASSNPREKYKNKYWEDYVPYSNIQYIKDNFPVELTEQFKIDMINKYGDRTVGLRKAKEALDHLNLPKEIKELITLEKYLGFSRDEKFEIKKIKDDFNEARNNKEKEMEKDQIKKVRFLLK